MRSRSEERIPYTRVLIDRNFKDRLATLTRDTPLYQGFRDRVKGLPAAQKAK